MVFIYREPVVRPIRLHMGYVEIADAFSVW